MNPACFFKILFFFCISLSAITTTTAHANCDKNEIEVDIQTYSSDPTNPILFGVKTLAEQINKEMNGSMCVNIYTPERFVRATKRLDSLAGGYHQLAVIPTTFASSTFKVFSLPFLFKDIDHFTRFTGSPSGNELITNPRNYGRGLTGLNMWMHGMMQLSAPKALKAPTDAHGLILNVKTMPQEMISVMGVKRESMRKSRIAPSLAAGLIDGEENYFPDIIWKTMTNSLQVITETNHSARSYVLMTSTFFLQDLPLATRQQFLDICSDVTKQQIRYAKSWNDKAKSKILSSGGQIHKLSPTEREVWVKAMRPILKKYEDKKSANIIRAVTQS